VRGSISFCACALAVLIAGCGGGGSSSTATTGTTAGTTGAPPAGAAGGKVQSGQSTGPGVIALPRGLGSLSYRCDHAQRGVSATLGGHILATESVYVEGDGRRHLRASRNVIANPFAVTDAHSTTLFWHVIQTTEPHTIDVRVAIDFHRPSCSPTRWTSTVYMISHDKQWTEPPGWL
jgi:hypothetical protein